MTTQGNAEYWRGRELANIANLLQSDAVHDAELKRLTEKAIKNTQDRIYTFYGKYAAAEGLTIDEAKQKAAAMDVEAFSKTAAEYVKNQDFSPEANEQLRLYNLAMKTNRLELLKSEMALEVVALGNEYQAYATDILTAGAKAEAERQAGILGVTLDTLDVKNARAIVQGSWKGATFSQRLWGNNVSLKNNLDNLLMQTIIAGRHPDAMAAQLTKQFNVSMYEASRLMRTESTRINSQLTQNMYEKYDVDYYEWVAEPSACPECAELNGRIWETKGAQAGDPEHPMPPMHPFCRCAVIPVVEETAAGKAEKQDKLKQIDEEQARIKEQAKRDAEARKQARAELEDATQLLSGSLPKDDYKKYLDLIEKNKYVADMYKRVADKLGGLTRKPAAGVFRPYNNEIEYSFSVSPGVHKYSTLSHEYGHAFDQLATFKGVHYKEASALKSRCTNAYQLNKMISREPASMSDEFLAAARADKKALLNLSAKERGERYRALGQDHASGGVQDAIQGLTGTRIHWGHSESYYNRYYRWTKQEGNDKELKSAYQDLGFDASSQNKVKAIVRDYDAASEMWANISSADLCQDKSLDYVKEYLPNSYAMYKKLMEGAI